MSKDKSLYNLLGDKYIYFQDNIEDMRNDDYESNIYFNVFNWLLELTLNRFTWENLPPSIKPEFIEKALIYKGKAIFFDSKDKYKYLCLPCDFTEDINVYGEPTKAKPIAFGEGINYRSYDIWNDKEAILIRDSSLMTPLILEITSIARLIAKMEVSYEMNVEQQRFPVFIVTDEDTKTSMEMALNKISRNQKFILASEEISKGFTDTKHFNNNIPYILDRLDDSIERRLNKFLSKLGLNNSNTIKKERLITDEVNSNNSYINYSIQKAFELRERACKEINEKFGLNISVKRTIDILPVEFGGDKNDDNNFGQTNKGGE